MPYLLEKHRGEFERALEHVRMEIAGLRSGRVSAALVEEIAIDAYGTKMSLKGVAAVGVTDARTLTVTPWDKALMKAVEDALRSADLGVNPVNEGTLIRLPFPAPTEESRKQMLKTLQGKLEEGRIRLRQVREEIKEKILAAEKGKEISEDDRFALLEKLDALAKDFNERIKKVGEEKEKEIMTI